MVLWAMLMGMITLINVTMVGAVMQVFGNVPDLAFLKIVSRYPRKKAEPEDLPLSPWQAAQRLRRVHTWVIRLCVAVAVAAIGISIWALAAGRGAVAMTAIALWVIAGNLFFSSIAPANWRRRAGRIDPNIYDEEPEGKPPYQPTERE